MRSLERERDLLRCFRFREPERDLDLLLFGDLQRRKIRAIRSEHHKAVNSLIFQTKATDLERDLECVLERVLMVFFSSVSKLSSSRPSGPSSRSMSYHSPAVTPHLHMFFLFLSQRRSKPAAGCRWSHPVWRRSPEAALGCCSAWMQENCPGRRWSPALRWKWP